MFGLARGAACAAASMLAIVGFTAVPAMATTYCVGTTLPVPGCTGTETTDLQVALDRGAPVGEAGNTGNDGVADAIVIGAGTFSTTAPAGFDVASGEFDPLEIRGAGAGATTITMPAGVKPDGPVLSTGFAPVTVRDLAVVLEDGAADSFSRALLVPTTGVLEDVAVTSNDPDSGALTYQDELTVRRSVVSKVAGSLNKTAINTSSSDTALTMEDSSVTGQMSIGFNGLAANSVLIRRSTLMGRFSARDTTSRIENSVLRGTDLGAAVRGASWPASLVVDHSTIIGSGEVSSVGVQANGESFGATVTVRDSIVQGYDSSVSALTNGGMPAGALTVTYSALDNLGSSNDGSQLTIGAGVTQMAPAFVDAAAGNFRLAQGSVGIDDGDPAPPDPPTTDFDGTARALDGDNDGSARSDMGAFEFVFPTRVLTLARTGAGSGSVTSSPAGVDCGAACAVSFPLGTQVTLSASPAAGSQFAGWSGSGCSGTGACVVTLDDARSVTAEFALAPVDAPPEQAPLTESPMPQVTTQPRITAPATCKIPRLKGLTVRAAKKRLRKAGCKGRITVKRPKLRKGSKRVRLRVKSSRPSARRVVPATKALVLTLRALPR